ncbi:MAG: hypothetical protein ABSG54_06260 [Terriglobia bacterium]|jgi:hypothetical protein
MVESLADGERAVVAHDQSAELPTQAMLRSTIQRRLQRRKVRH